MIIIREWKQHKEEVASYEKMQIYTSCTQSWTEVIFATSMNYSSLIQLIAVYLFS